MSLDLSYAISGVQNRKLGWYPNWMIQTCSIRVTCIDTDGQQFSSLAHVAIHSTGTDQLIRTPQHLNPNSRAQYRCTRCTRCTGTVSLELRAHPRLTSANSIHEFHFGPHVRCMMLMMIQYHERMMQSTPIGQCVRGRRGLCVDQELADCIGLTAGGGSRTPTSANL